MNLTRKEKHHEIQKEYFFRKQKIFSKSRMKHDRKGSTMYDRIVR